MRERDGGKRGIGNFSADNKQNSKMEQRIQIAVVLKGINFSTE